MTSGVGILFVDGRGEHAYGAQEQIAIFGGGLLQALDVLLDVAGHVIEGFSEFTDFGGATDLDALVKFGAAHGVNRKDKSANRTRDSDSEEISDKQGDDGDADDEAQGLRGEFVDTGIDARFVQAALRDDSPTQLGNRTVGADHFNGMLLVASRHEETHGFGGAQFLRQFPKMIYDRRIDGDVSAGNHLAGVRVGDDVAVTVNDEHDTVAHTGVANSGEQAVD